MTESELDTYFAEVSEELAEPGRWGTTFTLIQTWAQVPTLRGRSVDITRI